MTIASEIQRIKNNIAYAYTAAEAKGATLPVTENSDSLATTIESITGGGGEQVEAKNYTGANILEGDKVWINPYVIEPENPVAVQPFDSNQNYANFVPDEDGLFYYIYYNSAYSGYYRTSDNNKLYNLPNAGYARYSTLFADGTRYHVYIYSNNIYLEKCSKGTYWEKTGYMPVCNNKDYIIDCSNKLFCKVDTESGEILETTTINTTNNLFIASNSAFGAVLLDNTHLLFCSYRSARYFGLFTLNNGIFELTSEIDVGINFNYRRFCGITSDNKYTIGDYIMDISNVLTNNSINLYNFSDFNIPTTNYTNRLNQNGDYLEVFNQSGYDGKYPYLLYKYNTTTKTFNQIAIDTDMSGHWVVATAGNNTVQAYQTNPGNSANKGYIATSVTIDGTQLVQYKTGNITSDTQTGSAAENIVAGNTGLVNVGAVIKPTGSITITENGTHNVTDYAEAVVNVPVPVVDKYKVGDRVNDDSNNPVGTVSGFKTDANGNRYAVVCLDGSYRGNNLQYHSTNADITNLPKYSNQSVFENKETATFNTQKILDYTSSHNTSSTACTLCRAASFVINGVTYYGQLPTIDELIDIYKNRIVINTQDTSGNNPILDNSSSWSSTQNSSDYAWFIAGDASVMGATKTYDSAFVIPVLEIPL